jgi:colanic acid/amylovoran biosynthesis glycosyltransferase
MPLTAVLVSRFPLVTETFILREISEMERQGQPVRLVPMIRETPEVVHEAARPWVERALYTPWMWRFPLRTLGLLLRLVLGTVRKPGTLLRTLALFPKSVWLARQLEREGVTHLHAHFATHPATMALIISTLTGIPFSFTVHAHDIQLDRSLLRWKIAEAQFIRSISEFNRLFLEVLYPEARGKIEVIHVGVPLPPAPRAPRPRLILCVAAHKPYKGLPVLIEACRMLRAQGVKFRCDVVGDGPMRAQLEAMNDGAVNLLGPREENEVARMMEEASIFVLPSILAPDGQMEGIPVALMEALAHARPAVSTRISGIPELVQDGVNGLLVEPGDPVALAAAMRTLLDDPQRAAAMGARGRELVAREFELSACTAQLLALLEQHAFIRPTRERR